MSQEKPLYSRFLNLPEENIAWDSALCSLIQAPLETTTSFQHGTASAPQAILRASEQVELYDPTQGRDLSDLAIATVAAPKLGGLSTKDALASLETLVDKSLEAHKWPLVVGGEQTCSYAAVRAQLKRHPKICVVQLDAHLDLKDTFGGSGFSHRCAARRVLELGVSMIHLGARSFSRDEAEFADKAVTLLSVASLRKDPASFKRLLDKGIDPIYLSIDLSVLDPSVCPGVSNPEPAGLAWEELLQVVETLFASKTVVGADLVELSPQPGDARSELLAAKLALKLFELHQTGTTP
jgi:agmatinase